MPRYCDARASTGGCFRVAGRVTGMGRKECFELPSESRRLVAPEPGIVGAKVQEFEQLALELVAGRHKALVFSQQPGQRQSRRPGPGQADRRRRTGGAAALGMTGLGRCRSQRLSEERHVGFTASRIHAAGHCVCGEEWRLDGISYELNLHEHVVTAVLEYFPSPGGQFMIIAAILEPELIERILAHLGLQAQPQTPAHERQVAQAA